ncbi:MAG: hypothetical protein KDB82_10150 [Planctomycetes bacterium]|nr:hypothetical protein [Planctomycetota bacterium]
MSLRDQLEGEWARLGEVPPDALEDARLNAHFAFQVVAAAGVSLIPAADDDSHTSAEWLDRLQSLIGQEIPGGFRVALRLRDLRLQLLQKGGIELVSVPMEGKSIQAGIDWLKKSIKEEAGLDAPPGIGRPRYEMPEFDADKLKADPEKLGALARWYANADRALQFIAAREKEASRVMCWPHHFDLATLLTLEDGRTIGIGMSPGDENYRQPYYYVTPHPYPKGDLPALTGGGTWHRKGWTGAVLSGNKLASGDSASRQVETLTEFLNSAIAACREL